MGPRGLRGATGAKGNTGAIGPKGNTGPKGAQGNTGPIGPKGNTGAVGAKGNTGPIGPKGVQGNTGPQGPIGPKGLTGAVGPRGITGLRGSIGPQGPAGVVDVANCRYATESTETDDTSTKLLLSQCDAETEFLLTYGYSTTAPAGRVVLDFASLIVNEYYPIGVNLQVSEVVADGVGDPDWELSTEIICCVKASSNPVPLM